MFPARPIPLPMRLQVAAKTSDTAHGSVVIGHAGLMFTLSQVVPLGRSFHEYCGMFALSEIDLRRKTLGCADGPASFNAEATRRARQVVSCDPLYRFDSEQIRSRIDATFPVVMDQTRRNAAQFVWNDIPSLEELERRRWKTMQVFLADYEQGKLDGRYVEAELPLLPFADGSFDLALCSHFLFLYTEQLSESFHRLAITEMCRVGREVRIFPLIALDGRPSAHVDPVIDRLKESGFVVTIETVPYEFQRGANQMMRIRGSFSH
jgi:hypothetical protein